MKLKNGLCIDLGHGGKDPGACGERFEEAMIVLAIGNELKSLLEAKGIKNKFTRNTDTFLSLQERCNIANNFNADLFLSIHINSSNNKEAYGTEAWVYSLKNNKSAIDLSTWITNDLTKLLNTKNRGVKENTKFTILKNSKMPAIILEVDFISNSVMEQRMKENVKAIAREIYNNILKFYEMPIDQLEEKLYKVFIGAFKSKENAVNLKTEAIKKGFADAYIL